MSVEVLQSGLCTTVQDMGRFGHQQHGVIVSGAMDTLALRLANRLVGNPENDAALEITLLGPKLKFHEDQLIAICGGVFSPMIDGKPVPSWRPVWVSGGSVLEFGQAKKGCRAYISFAGGIDVPQVLGSRSTYLRAEIGGFKGRPLKKGDSLQMNQPNDNSMQLIGLLANKRDRFPFVAADWYIGETMLPSYEKSIVRVIRGPQFDQFSQESRRVFFQQEFQISPQSDRMGYRLSGSRLELEQPLELLSEAVTAGTIQVPSDGQPIILMADRQTTGGYPKLGFVASVDLPILAQRKPGTTIRFKEISLMEAQQEMMKVEGMIKTFSRGIDLITRHATRS
ncbi:biotin-dependent carboxyltransferase family protein [Paenibacillus sp. BSR1-1]|uniref:5-oxoprolinase subunit C family protein n=1 Tax=Paenibacillus sp. BSR1-1 TaxID=3020845 RepID=UPI0025B0B7E4|nr:biotin-dependent carboxyltransferase family protein [Paenibacillus sp. BSR1-1]MDN3014601.1 biotin-dependent carboxyltransferase family protein [Paenibacillus sp. BSR1-1]